MQNNNNKKGKNTAHEAQTDCWHRPLKAGSTAGFTAAPLFENNEARINFEPSRDHGVRQFGADHNWEAVRLGFYGTVMHMMPLH